MSSKSHEENDYICDLDVLIISHRLYGSNPSRSGRIFENACFKPTYLTSYVALGAITPPYVL